MKQIVMFADERDDESPDQIIDIPQPMLEDFYNVLIEEDVFVRVLGECPWAPAGVIKIVDLEDYMEEFHLAATQLNELLRRKLLDLSYRYRFVGFYE